MYRYTDRDFFVSQRGFTLLGKMACFRFGEVFSLVGLLLLPVVHGILAEVRAKATQGVFQYTSDIIVMCRTIKSGLTLSPRSNQGKKL